MSRWLVLSESGEVLREVAGERPGCEIGERVLAESERIAAVERLQRAERNKRLAECDWTQLRDIAETVPHGWQDYRRALRDITDQPGWPLEVVWPNPPQ